MTIKAMDVKEVPVGRQGGKGVSFEPLVQEILASGADSGTATDDKGRQFATVNSGVRAYLRLHPDTPIRVYSRNKELWFARTDTEAGQAAIAKLDGGSPASEDEGDGFAELEK